MIKRKEWYSKHQAKTKIKEQWRPKMGESYWHLTSAEFTFDPVRWRNTFDAHDSLNFQIGNYFKTKTKALKIRKQFLALLKDKGEK